MGIFTRLGHAIARVPRLVVILATLATIGLYALSTVGVNGEGLFQRVTTGPPLVDGSQSWEVTQAQERTADPAVGPRLASYVRDARPDDAGVQAAMEAALALIAEVDHVASVATPFAGPPEARAALVDAADAGFLVDVAFSDPGDDALALHEEVAAIMAGAVADMHATQPDASVLTFSSPLVFDDFTHQLERDLVTGELIALPAALIVMVFVFGGFLAAATPLTGAIASIAGGLAVLYGFSYLLDLDQSAVNVVTVLGIGLSIDYGLLLVSRFREELHRLGGDPREARDEALVRTLATAGRTVAFSGLIVAVSVGGMLAFSPEMIRGIGGAAVGVVTTAMVAALTVVPAVLYLLAPRIVGAGLLARLPGVRRVVSVTSNVDREDGAFARLATRVQRRPWLVMIGATALLLVLASPVLGLTLRNSDIEALPVGNERRDYVVAFEEGFPHLVEPAVTVHSLESPDALAEWLTAVAELDGVAGVEEPVVLEGETFVGVRLDTTDATGPEAASTVREMREVPADVTINVGGAAATQIDFIDAIAEGALVAGALVVVATFVLLFLMTGSLLVPVKTLLINALSLLATLGVVTWIFGEGNLESPLGFTSTGGVETYVAVIIVAFGFGLAMDYEVFLLARVKEYVDAGESNDAAVRKGLQRSGRIITSAAAVIVLVFLGFAMGDLLMIKEVGVGLAFAVLLDATVVRLLLVPATMTLLGDWNWWAPGPLRRLHQRIGLTHE